MPVRTRAWLQVGALGALIVVLTAAFVGALDLPRTSHAQEATPAGALTLPASPAPTQSTVPELRAAPSSPSAVASVGELSEAFVHVSEVVRPAVVYIRSERRESARDVPPGVEQFFRTPDRPPVRRGEGSGFIVSSDGVILTNNHVVENASKVTVRLLDRREFTARVVGTDPLTDIAALKIDASGLSTVKLGDSDAARIGEWVLAVGNPLGEEFAFTVTAGIISAKSRSLAGLPIDPEQFGYRIQDFIQTDAAINPGNSGGPLVNLAGEAIGINSAIASGTGYYQGYGFAIPANLARSVMEQLIAEGRVRRAVIGVQVAPITPEAAEYVGLKDIQGVVVQDFSSEDSPAKRAGIRKGDVIVEVDRTPIEQVAQLQQVVGFKKPGETTQVTVQRRGGERRSYTVRLVEAPTTAAVASRDEGNEPTVDMGGNLVDRLGIQVRALTSQQRRDPRLSAISAKGLVVVEVEPEGPAENLLAPANTPGGPDIIVSVNEQAVASEEDLLAVLRRADPGSVVALEVYNYGNQTRRIVYLRLEN